ncbi:hypothetical protein [Litchfieldia alkalitelluris]|uniref:hypothetical protein n=1 Tax=Litchfieldia alkalitelluris TaxID=304268 RepID=UPI0011164D43|nr:hypothetical protein [Litchfieldia alkalitelluris]
MANSRRRPIINAEKVIIHADEVIVIEANDRRRHHRQDIDDVAGVEDRKRHRGRNEDDVAGVEDRRHHRRVNDDDVAGIEQRKPRFPW